MSPDREQFERAFEIIEAYGSDKARWPDEERSSVEQTIARSPDLQMHFKVHRALDDQLKALEVRPRLNPEIIAQHIAAYPQRLSRAQWFQLQLEHLTESMMVTLWRPVVAASFVFFIGVGAGTVAVEPEEDWSQAEQFSFAVIGEEASP